MPDFLRLKQICLVAPHLEPVATEIGAIMGLDICYRDPAVGAYGLQNVLYPVDSTLLEVSSLRRERIRRRAAILRASGAMALRRAITAATW